MLDRPGDYQVCSQIISALPNSKVFYSRRVHITSFRRPNHVTIDHPASNKHAISRALLELSIELFGHSFLLTSPLGRPAVALGRWDPSRLVSSCSKPTHRWPQISHASNEAERANCYHGHGRKIDRILLKGCTFTVTLGEKVSTVCHSRYSPVFGVSFARLGTYGTTKAA